MYALVLTIEELRNFIDKSRDKATRTPYGGVFIYCRNWFRASFLFGAQVNGGMNISLHQRGVFGVARFRLVGQCEGLSIVERVTNWLHAFCMYMRIYLILMFLSQGGLG